MIESKLVLLETIHLVATHDFNRLTMFPTNSWTNRRCQSCWICVKWVLL